MEEEIIKDWKECTHPVEFYEGKCPMCGREMAWGICEELEYKSNFEPCPICGIKVCKKCLILHILQKHFYMQMGQWTEVGGIFPQQP